MARAARERNALRRDVKARIVTTSRVSGEPVARGLNLPMKFSSWMFVALIGLLLLQLLPGVGEIAGLFGAALLSSLAAHACLIALGVEVYSGRRARLWLAIPALAYGGYYAVFLSQYALIVAEEADLRARNPVAALEFDPKIHSLLDHSDPGDAKFLLSHFQIPVVYDGPGDDPTFLAHYKYPDIYNNEALKYEFKQYEANRLISAAQCQAAENELRSEDPVGDLTRPRIERIRLEDLETEKLPCILTLREPLTARLVAVTRRFDKHYNALSFAPTERFIDFSLDGHLFASYRQATAGRLSPLPLFGVGCVWMEPISTVPCGVGAYQETRSLDDLPAAATRTAPYAPIAIVLGLRGYSAGRIAALGAQPDDGEAAARLAPHFARQANLRTAAKAFYFDRFVAFLKNTHGEGDAYDYAAPVSDSEKAFVQQALDQWPDRAALLLPDMATTLAREVFGAPPNYCGASWLDVLLRALVRMPAAAFDQLSGDGLKALSAALGRVQSCHPDLRALRARIEAANLKGQGTAPDKPAP